MNITEFFEKHESKDTERSRADVILENHSNLLEAFKLKGNIGIFWLDRKTFMVTKDKMVPVKKAKYKGYYYTSEFDVPGIDGKLSGGEVVYDFRDNMFHALIAKTYLNNSKVKKSIISTFDLDKKKVVFDTDRKKFTKEYS